MELLVRGSTVIQLDKVGRNSSFPGRTELTGGHWIAKMPNNHCLHAEELVID